jgi:hypothetical protein
MEKRPPFYSSRASVEHSQLKTLQSEIVDIGPPTLVKS